LTACATVAILRAVGALEAVVIPAQAGIQLLLRSEELDPGLRRDDDDRCAATTCKDPNAP
jgi:hypothetical protein